jgi:hypothetical protein
VLYGILAGTGVVTAADKVLACEGRYEEFVFDSATDPICNIMSPFCPKDDIEFLTKTTNLNGINFQKVKVGVGASSSFLVSLFG